MSGSLFGWVCSQQRVPQRRSASLTHFNGQLKGKQNSRNETFPDFSSSLEEEASFRIFMYNINTVDIMKMNAATTFNYSLPLALYWYCVCSWVMYAPKTCICAFMVLLYWVLCIFMKCTQMHVYVCVPPCAYVCIYLCWQGERLARARSLAVVYRSMASSPSLCRPLAALHTPQGGSLLPWQWWAKIEETSLAGCRLCCLGLRGWCSPQQKGAEIRRCTRVNEMQLSMNRSARSTLTHSCVILNDFNSISLLQTGARPLSLKGKLPKWDV